MNPPKKIILTKKQEAAKTLIKEKETKSNNQ